MDNSTKSIFDGTWIDLAKAEITITGNKNHLLITYPPGRGAGPFHGFEVDLFRPVINVDFYDKGPETGVLSNDNTTIFWGNESRWVRSTKK